MNELEEVRLTKYAKRAGCAAKQPPDYLLSLLAGLPPITDPNVLVGHATSDDAAVYKLSDDLALILTTDFFTPIVDRPYDFGAIAAANALSDVYAMAGVPLAALSLVGFPSGALPSEVLGEILRARPKRPMRRASPSSAATQSSPKNPSSVWPSWGVLTPASSSPTPGAAGRFPGADQTAWTGNHHHREQARRRRSGARSMRRSLS